MPDAISRQSIFADHVSTIYLEKMTLTEHFFAVFMTKSFSCKSFDVKTTDDLIFFIKSTLSGLRQFLTTANLFEMMNNAFYVTLKALFILKILKFLSRIFGLVEKPLN